jgi:hypothetical protein
MLAEAVRTFPISERTATSDRLRRNWQFPVLAGALALWIIGLRQVELGQMNDFGLISVIPIPVFLALFGLTVSYCITLRDSPVRESLLFIHIVVLIVMLYGITSIVEDVPRFESAWKHIGITDYVIRNGSIDPGINAYFSWPGFFILLAFISETAHLSSPLVLVSWTPVVAELLYLAPLLTILRWATSDRRLTWLAIWVFYLANWIGQDYLSPQAFGYLLYLGIFAILLNWFSHTEYQPHPLLTVMKRIRLPNSLLGRLCRYLCDSEALSPKTQRWKRIVLVAMAFAMYAALVPSHQLTPFAILAGVTALVVIDRCTLWWLPALFGVTAFLWLVFGAEAYFAGHGEQVAGQVGDVGGAIGAGVVDRISGSYGHIIVTYMRTGSALIMFVLAFLGGLRRLFQGRRDVSMAVLAAVPFPLVALQSYGGEILLRAYFFALPFMAFFAAALFISGSQRQKTWLSTALLIVVSTVAIGTFFVTRYGNERMDYFTTKEVAASEYLYDVAPPGSLLVAGTVKTPWKQQDYERYTYRTLSEDMTWNDQETTVTALSHIRGMLSDTRYPAAFLLITRSQIANDEMFDLLPLDLTEIENAVETSPEFVLVYSNEDARVYEFRPAADQAPA